MHTSIEPAPPARVAAAIEAFCADIRRRGTSIYARLLRENVLDVLRCSFPRFSADLGAALEPLARGFLAAHAAERPQFHHIATEFVAYAQGLGDLPRRALCLLEYEWALLAAEIDAAQVPPAAAVDAAKAAKLPLATNPTLRVVALPFDVERTDAADAEGHVHVYAIYRTRRHLVLVKRLGLIDRLLIDGIQRLGRLDAAAAQPWLQAQDGAGVAVRWLAQGLDDELIHLNAPNPEGDLP